MQKDSSDCLYTALLLLTTLFFLPQTVLKVPPSSRHYDGLLRLNFIRQVVAFQIPDCSSSSSSSSSSKRERENVQQNVTVGRYVFRLFGSARSPDPTGS